MTEPTAATPQTPYRVLARKYRPQTFAEMIGQEALVRTLENAIASGRLAHAFMLTGVRGVGKTTTARILARALNCTGPDGTGGPTVSPCGVCDSCRGIAEDRHPDVLEMDAASRTGVGDIRELIEGVRYRPVSARYKVYIIDEVHMLSNAAFNALLKTLEEPPPDVKFIFATTEIRKVPVTVLSRCQRFDLRRVELDVLAQHFAAIAGKEGIGIEEGALRLVARAADGSVRDGLSILDQAIALGSAGEGGETVTEASVKGMLGLADRDQTLDLFDAAMRGDPAAALERLAGLHGIGADPVVVIQDLLELTHFLTRLKVAPQSVAGSGLSDAELKRGQEISGKLGIAALARAWQMLLKGLGEVQTAPNPLQAAEMVLIRLAHVAELPPPADLIRQIRESGGSAPAPRPSPSTGAPPTGAPSGVTGGAAGNAVSAQAPQSDDPPPWVTSSSGNGGGMQAMRQPQPVESGALSPNPQSFEQAVALFNANREVLLLTELEMKAHLVRFEPGRIELRLEPTARPDLANQVGKFLTEWTGQRWVVSLSNAPGAPSLAEQRQAVADERLVRAGEHPYVQAVKQHFPGAVIADVRALKPDIALPTPDLVAPVESPLDADDDIEEED
ncbi:DNA polymerase III subunit gamma/tau [Oceanibaculum pacificum]|uniref:DNA polymerase III subunit gamma/tau n=1 Tax=Oceanibaculum pacificum TaxID=580166 RepID=A0A154VDX9_9PROT|nr:DNA polymerase III subunit gamma/tau [Oceanibaculum pacificum]KZC99600.1 DNA polymerase III subunit gamma/tau [Oceanibaculum pacificum]